MGLDLTSFDSALRSYYTDARVENMVYQDNPLLAMVGKMEKFYGRNLPIVLIYGNPQGRSANFAQAQTRGGVTSTKVEDFLLTRVRDYSIATIDNETLEASINDAGAAIEAATTEIDGAINSLTRSLATKIFRTSAGSIGRVNATPANNSGTFVVRLQDIEEIVNFELQQQLVIWSALTGGSQRTSDGAANTFVVQGINRSTGDLTLQGTYSGSGTIVSGDYIFVNGDRGAAMSGLEDWIPLAGPTGTPFFGVDRTQDTVRLAGVVYDGSSQPIEEALIDCAARIGREGGKPDICLVSHKKFAELEKSLGAKVQYVDLQVNTEIGFRGISISGPRGNIKVVADQNCQNRLAWMLQMNTWKLYSLGKAVRVIDTDGLQMLRQASADGVECRYGFYGNLGCNAPGYNGVCILD